MVTEVRAADLLIQVQSGEKNTPVEYAVIIATPLSVITLPEEDNSTFVVDQVDKEFIPHVSVVRKGTAIQFPNSDNIHHHVYSFSPVKLFELPLYTGIPNNPIRFDKEGIVKLGCNIHDWMFAYVYVVDSPFNAVTAKDGKARIINLPPGDYEISILHYNMDPDLKMEKINISINEEKNVELRTSVTLKPGIHPRRSPMHLNRGGY